MNLADAEKVESLNKDRPGGKDGETKKTGDSGNGRYANGSKWRKRNVKLTKLSKCAGCGAKVGAGVLAKLLSDIKVHSDPNLLVGFDKSDDASVYKISDELALVQTVDFSHRSRMSLIFTGPLPRPMPCLMSMPWAVSQGLPRIYAVPEKMPRRLSMRS